MKQCVPVLSEPKSGTTFTATIRTISPVVAKVYLAAAAKILIRFRIVAALHKKENKASHQVGDDKPPTDRRDMQIIINHASTAAEQPDIANDNRQNGRRAKDNKPGILVFSKFNLHLLATSFKCLHHGQYFTQPSCTFPHPGQVSRSTARHCGQTNQPDSTVSEQPGHSPDRGAPGGTGLSSSMQMK